MLLNGHHLDTIVTVLDDAWQHIVLELSICANLLGILSHTHMTLIDEQRVLLGFEVLLLELVWFLRIPYLGGEYLCTFVLEIIVMNQGRILQRGRHEELIAQEGFYQQLMRSE